MVPAAMFVQSQALQAALVFWRCEFFFCIDGASIGGSLLGFRKRLWTPRALLIWD